MKMDIVAGSGNDEFYTPRYAIRPILKFIGKNSIVWCPFDTEDSLFKELLEAEGHIVITSHIEEGGDFFKIEPPHSDYIISNPPYSIKTEVLEELFKIGKKFAMLVGVVGLFESQRRFDMFNNNVFEILYLNRRVSYFKSYEEAKPAMNPPFSSVYVCSGMLHNQICFEEIDKKDL